MKVYSGLLLLSVFFLTADFGVDAFCQAIDGVYWERPDDPGAQESPAVVNVVYHYDLEVSNELATTTSTTTTTTPDKATIAEALQHRIADALVFTLFDDCRVDQHDKMADVNLERIAVTVEISANNGFEVHIQALGDTAVQGAGTAVAEMLLENAVRITVTAHHVARFSVQPGVILTLRLPQQPTEPGKGHGDDVVPSTPSPPATPPSIRNPLLVALLGGCGLVALVTALVFYHQNASIETRHVHFSLPGEDDDVELACSKPTHKLLRKEHCDPTETETELSESSTSGELDGW